MNRSTVDEIYFFLFCRFLLFKGSQLEIMNGTVDIIHWISYNHANFIVDTVFERFNIQM